MGYPRSISLLLTLLLLLRRDTVNMHILENSTLVQMGSEASLVTADASNPNFGLNDTDVLALTSENNLTKEHDNETQSETDQSPYQTYAKQTKYSDTLEGHTITPSIVNYSNESKQPTTPTAYESSNETEGDMSEPQLTQLPIIEHHEIAHTLVSEQQQISLAEEREISDSAHITIPSNTNVPSAPVMNKQKFLINTSSEEHKGLDSAGVVALFEHLIREFKVPSKKLQKYQHIAALKGPDGSLYVPHQGNQSRSNHLETLLGFAMEIFNTKSAEEQFEMGEAPSAAHTTPALLFTNLSGPQANRSTELAKLDGEKEQTDTNTNFNVSIEPANTSVYTEGTEMAIQADMESESSFGTILTANGSMEVGNHLTDMVTQKENSTLEADTDTTRLDTTATELTWMDNKETMETVQKIDSQLSALTYPVFNASKDATHAFTNIVTDVADALNVTLRDPENGS